MKSLWFQQNHFGDETLRGRQEVPEARIQSSPELAKRFPSREFGGDVEAEFADREQKEVKVAGKDSQCAEMTESRADPDLEDGMDIDLAQENCSDQRRTVQNKLGLIH